MHVRTSGNTMSCHATDGVNWRKDKFEAFCKGGHFNMQDHTYEEAQADVTYRWGHFYMRT